MKKILLLSFLIFSFHGHGFSNVSLRIPSLNVLVEFQKPSFSLFFEEESIRFPITQVKSKKECAIGYKQLKEKFEDKIVNHILSGPVSSSPSTGLLVIDDIKVHFKYKPRIHHELSREFHLFYSQAKRTERFCLK